MCLSGSVYADCVSATDVANAWKTASVGSSSSPTTNDTKLCVQAVAVAYGESYDTKSCPKRFSTIVCNPTSTSQCGIWQLGYSLGTGTINEQAKNTYSLFTSNNPDYGCLASWQKKPEIIFGFSDYDVSTSTGHVFCQAVWTGDAEKGNGYYKKHLEDAVKACVAAGFPAIPAL